MSSADRGLEQRVLVLQGGGALGSYQAGVAEELLEGGLFPHWVAGISIGAVNAAIIAGNPPELRIEKLRAFWTRMTSGFQFSPSWPMEAIRSSYNNLAASLVATFGVAGFFAPRLPPPFLLPPGSPEAVSFYDTSALRATLLDLVDFDHINRREIRLSVGAVNIRTGNFTYFDNQRQEIGPQHIMASGALPPGFPPIEIDGEYYWDGGLVSNTPLQYVLDEERHHDLMICQVDLFRARGPLPRNLSEAAEREKDIRYSSRTRLNTDDQIEMRKAKGAFRRLSKKIPPDLLLDPDAAFLLEMSAENSVSILQLIYRRKPYEGHAKDYEFSRQTMIEHWEAGRRDVRKSIEHRGWLDHCRLDDGIAVFDFTKEDQR